MSSKSWHILIFTNTVSNQRTFKYFYMFSRCSPPIHRAINYYTSLFIIYSWNLIHELLILVWSERHSVMIYIRMISDSLSRRFLAARVNKWKLEPVPSSVAMCYHLELLLSSREQNYSAVWGAKITVKNVSFMAYTRFVTAPGVSTSIASQQSPPGTVESQFCSCCQGWEEVESPMRPSGGGPGEEATWDSGPGRAAAIPQSHPRLCPFPAHPGPTKA